MKYDHKFEKIYFKSDVRVFNSYFNNKSFEPQRPLVVSWWNFPLFMSDY